MKDAMMCTEPLIVVIGGMQRKSEFLAVGYKFGRLTKRCLYNLNKVDIYAFSLLSVGFQRVCLFDPHPLSLAGWPLSMWATTASTFLAASTDFAPRIIESLFFWVLA
ncbi:hypothetical protein D8B26_004165 [Coccidioides posadasii str. Silveira]|uniref:uncharacterized protein n=1 Tax=Coccidioides posadasii (strain RMSCC 757 / Silveira) TaxID=443226 RepID=UPI001BF13A13|nr:hypothetical protein D8B26_004165 [Coccidioides posadasii str. Silveira]